MLQNIVMSYTIRKLSSSSTFWFNCFSYIFIHSDFIPVEILISLSLFRSFTQLFFAQHIFFSLHPQTRLQSEVAYCNGLIRLNLRLFTPLFTMNSFVHLFPLPNTSFMREIHEPVIFELNAIDVIRIDFDVMQNKQYKLQKDSIKSLNLLIFWIMQVGKKLFFGKKIFQGEVK